MELQGDYSDSLPNPNHHRLLDPAAARRPPPAADRCLKATLARQSIRHALSYMFLLCSILPDDRFQPARVARPLIRPGADPRPA